MSDTNTENKFVYGVLDTFELASTSDIAVVGRVKGTIKKGDKICISNYGDDDDELVVSSIVALEIDRKKTESATDCFVAVRIKDGLAENIKPGSVLHSENAEDEEIHQAYVGAIGDSYVGKRDLELYESEISKMSITDCSEAWRIFVKVHEKKEGGFTEEEIKEFRRKIGIVARNMAKKILAADEIYSVKSKITGEPHMFTHVNKVGEDYTCSPPEFHIFSKPYKKIAEKVFPSDMFEIEKIERGENGNGIRQFLFDAFYLNGAMGVRVNFEAVAIGAETFIPKPNYSGKKESEIPVTNPTLVRWMLLRAQIGSPKTEDEKMVAKIYYRFFSMELLKAKFVIPMKEIEEGENAAAPMLNGKEEANAEVGENGEMPELKKLRFPILVGKNRRNLVFLFTDMKRLRAMYDEDWGAFIHPVEKFVNSFDVGINISNKYNSGCYLNKETVDEIKRMLGIIPPNYQQAPKAEASAEGKEAKPEEATVDAKEADKKEEKPEVKEAPAEEKDTKADEK